jgi:hypothetical protein
LSLIGYVDNSGITDSLGVIPGTTRFAELDSGIASLADDSVKACLSSLRITSPPEMLIGTEKAQGSPWETKPGMHYSYC